MEDLANNRIVKARYRAVRQEVVEWRTVAALTRLR